ncbi:MAG: hypothetical protein EP346_00025 [Bacteroidetes bacterium]|nr:MAG: hypothetical protein EP346_00025 [Bacteroidota bacterium]
MRQTVQPNQDILDVVLNHSGTLENLGDFLAANPQLNLDQDLAIGQVVEVEVIGDNSVVNYYYERNIIPANGRIELLPSSGFGFDYELDFEFN